jgi:hypothetical protein
VAVLATISPTQRALLAAVLTAIAVAPFEAVSFYKGAYPGWWIGVFGAPLVVALIFYSSMRARLLAWLLLTLLSVLVVVAVNVGLWYA